MIDEMILAHLLARWMQTRKDGFFTKPIISIYREALMIYRVNYDKPKSNP